MPSGWCGRPSEPVAVQVRSPAGAAKSEEVAEKLKRGVLKGAVLGAVIDQVASVLLHCVTDTLAGSRPSKRGAMVSISVAAVEREGCEFTPATPSSSVRRGFLRLPGGELTRGADTLCYLPGSLLGGDHATCTWGDVPSSGAQHGVQQLQSS